MTKRLWIVTVCGVLTCSVNVRAQSGAPNLREALASQYVNTETGLTLGEAIARALAQEPTLRATRTEVDVATGARLQARLRPNPTVSFTQQAEPSGTDSQSRVEMQWPLDLFRRTGRVAVAEQELQATQQSVSDRERLLAADVRLKYGEVVAAVRDLSVSDDLVATTTRQSELLRARVDQGGTPPARTQHGGSGASSAPGRAISAGGASGSSRDRAEAPARHERERSAPTARLARTTRDPRSGRASDTRRHRGGDSG